MLSAFAVAATFQATPAVPPPDPCADPARTVACPNLVMRRPYGFHMERTKGGRRLLQSANAIVNVGEGPLEVRAKRTAEYEMAARQVLRGPSPVVLPDVGAKVGLYNTRTRGTYWKFRDAAGFTLSRVSPDGTEGPVVRRSPKIFYCFRDLREVRRLDTGERYDAAPRTRQFGACSTRASTQVVTLGTSVGWADIYPYHYPQNSIDVTGLSGCFRYTQTVDPKDHLRELREDDNSSSVVVRLPWRGPGARGCPA